MTESFRYTRVVHRTAYRYRAPVSLLPHRLVVRPREGHDIQLERFELTVSPPAVVHWSRDIFGNSIARVHFSERADELRIDVTFVARRRIEPPDSAHPVPITLSYPMEYDPLEQAVTVLYNTPGYPADGQVVHDWLHAAPVVAGVPAEDLVRLMTRRVHETIAYRRREEKGVQSPAATLALGTGSCRDQATLLMEALRHLGIASRFVSGYLDSAATRAGRGSTHAWCEVYFPDLGWRGFDPTTGRPCSDQHIAVGASHHPRGVMPVSGRFLGEPDAFREMAVTVEIGDLPASSLLSAESPIPHGAP